MGAVGQCVVSNQSIGFDLDVLYDLIVTKRGQTERKQQMVLTTLRYAGLACLLSYWPTVLKLAGRVAFPPNAWSILAEEAVPSSDKDRLNTCP